ncbi:MAG: hypothetical protein EOO88_10980, partial [Pedobacter sp.]
MYLTALAISFASCSFLNANAQNAGVYLNDVSGYPLRIPSETDISGTPFLTKDWQLANVKLKNGKVYKNMKLKLNLLDHKFVFQGDANTIMGFTEAIESVTFDPTFLREKPMFFKDGFSGADIKPTEFLEVIILGLTQLLKKDNVTIKETKEYNSAITEKTYVTKPTYYLFKKDNTIIQLSLNKKDILSSLTDHTKEVESYINENKLNLKKEDDLMKLMSYYNS